MEIIKQIPTLLIPVVLIELGLMGHRPGGSDPSRRRTHGPKWSGLWSSYLINFIRPDHLLRGRPQGRVGANREQYPC